MAARPLIELAIRRHLVDSARLPASSTAAPASLQGPARISERRKQVDCLWPTGRPAQGGPGTEETNDRTGPKATALPPENLP
jgi:hypothetical protein